MTRKNSTIFSRMVSLFHMHDISRCYFLIVHVHNVLMLSQCGLTMLTTVLSSTQALVLSKLTSLGEGI